ncbi:MAG: OB-fold nucleic acid binding domain-containing protein, partial [Anaerolineaceae bacterium]
MELTDLERIRLAKIQRMRAAGREPYPTRSYQTHSVQDALHLFTQTEEANGDDLKITLTLAGRLRAMRTMGKIIFAHVEDGSGRIQFFFRINELGTEQMDILQDEFDLGDFIEAEGEMMRTRTGEISLLVKSFRMLAKAITPLPAAKDEVL